VGFQAHFRINVGLAITAGLASLGRKTDAEVYLVGFRIDEGRHPICVEPEDSYIVPSKLQDVRVRGEALYQEHLDSRLYYSTAHLHMIRINGSAVD
jgi:hypothetical protein